MQHKRRFLALGLTFKQVFCCSRVFLRVPFHTIYNDYEQKVIISY